MDVGSWTELVSGLASAAVAGVLGWLAVREAKAANYWAEESVNWSRRATEATDRANQIALSALPIRFKPAYDLEWFEGPHMEDLVTITNDGPTVWIHDVAIGFGVFYDLSGKTRVVMGSSALDQRDPDEKPCRRHQGEWIVYEWPFSTVNLNFAGHWMQATVEYSIERDGEVRAIQTGIEFPGKGPHWPGVAPDERGGTDSVGGIILGGDGDNDAPQ